MLSGGQRQRIAIARALLRDTPVLILDEPTTGLDVQSAERILRPLRDLMVGRTTIIVSHHLPLLIDVTHVAVMDGGRVIEQGRREQMEGSGGGYADLCRLYMQLANGSAASARGAAADAETRGPDIAPPGVDADVAGGV